MQSVSIQSPDSTTLKAEWDTITVEYSQGPPGKKNFSFSSNVISVVLAPQRSTWCLDGVSSAVVSPAQVAIAWLLTKPFISSIIIGANKMQHLENNLGAVELRLSACEVEKLDVLTNPQPLYPGWMQNMGWDTKVKAALDPE